MKHIMISILVVLFCISNTQGQECSKDLELVNSIFEKLNLEQALTDPDAILTEFDNLKNSLGSISFKSLKKSTPKLLFLNGKHKKGSVKRGKKRIYVTSVVPRDTLSVLISNPNQIGAGQVVICAHSKDGTTENLEQFQITEETTSEVLQFQLVGIRAKVVSIAIKNTSKNEKWEFEIMAE